MAVKKIRSVKLKDSKAFKKLKLENLKFKFWMILELVVLAFLIALLAISYLKPGGNEVPIKSVANMANKAPTSKSQASNSATISSTPIPVASVLNRPAPVIPQNSGKSVRVPILYYHYIGNNPNPADTARDSLSITPDLFEKQMNYLSSNGFNTISLDTLYAALKGGLLPPKPVVLTFDDGYVDFYVNAFPILERYHIHATSFIPTSLIGGGYYMSWNQIKEIQSSGLISFEAHSLTHPNLVSLSPEAAKNQITESRKVLESEIGVPVNFFAYPYGASNSQDWEYAKEAGYAGAVGTWSGKFESEGDEFDWPRIRMGGAVPMSTFEADVQ